jgi:hypothetical protein
LTSSSFLSLPESPGLEFGFDFGFAAVFLAAAAKTPEIFPWIG